MPPRDDHDALTAPHVDTYQGGSYTTPSIIGRRQEGERMAERQIKDARGWSAVDHGYLDNPKMMDVLDASSIAVLMHLASVLYCAQHLTDGHVSPGAARRKVGGSRDDDALLIASGLWHAPGHDCPQCPQPEPGKVYVHNFLEHNRPADKAKRASERASEAAKARWEKRRADASTHAEPHAEPHADTHATGMPDALPGAMLENDSGNAEREKERERDITTSAIADAAPPRADVEALCQQLADRVVANGSKRPTISKRWRDAARLMIDADGRTPEQIAAVIDWSQSDSFWQGNILSMPKVREKFDTLRMQSQRATPGQQKRVGMASQMPALRFYGAGASE